MKNNVKQIIFLWFCLLCGMAYGQTGTLYRVPTSGTNQIVRYDPVTMKHVIYSRSMIGDNVFSLTDMTTLVSVTIGKGLDVRDFEIIDGLVFFCGENGAGSGFLGWFDINDLFYLGGTAQIDQTLVTLGLLSLDNIEVYRNPASGNFCVAGYGLHSNLGVGWNLYRAFEAVGIPTIGMQYRTNDLYSPGPYAVMSDVVVTDHFVVYLSTDNNMECYPYVGIGITIHPFPKYDMFGNPPFYHHFFQLTYISSMYSYGYVLPINDDPYREVRPMMVHSTGDEVAVCTYRKDLDETSWIVPTPPDSCGNILTPIKTYLSHMVFDLSSLVPSTNNVIQMTSYYIAQLYHGTSESIDGFVYDPQTHRYAILHRHESSTGVLEHAVTTINSLGGTPAFFESSYQTAFNTSSIWMPTSMCLDGYVYYTVVGHDNLSNEYMLWHKSIGSVVGGWCDHIVQYPAKPLPLVPEKYYTLNVTPMTWKPLQFVSLGVWPRMEYPCSNICQ